VILFPSFLYRATTFGPLHQLDCSLFGSIKQAVMDHFARLASELNIGFGRFLFIPR
jgi:hypothetical protein